MATIFKPVIKTERAIKSANRYRKGFRLLVEEKGSIGKAYQCLRRLKKTQGLRAAKQLLREQLESPIPVQLPEKYCSRYEVEPVRFVERTAFSLADTQKQVKVICFYLPQFHPFPENDEWWGKGFTEWTNVKPALPQYENHYQPHIPHDDLGYYSLLDKETQLKQIDMAKQYGIEGFCYYLYWFAGHRLMETPLDNMLADKTIDFPFCVCWANENWTRRWDGLENDVLIAQDYSEKDDLAFIENIAKYLKDPRYIRIDGKPLLLVYRPNLLPDMAATAQRWRTWCRDNGVGEIYLAYPQSFESNDPAEYGFDAAVEFPPNNSNPPLITDDIASSNTDFEGEVYDWRMLLERSDHYTTPDYTLFRGATPSWDNTARKKNKGIILEHSSPLLFEKYLVNAFSDTVIRHQNADERLVFVNAWNEWAEGAHLEPDQKYGYAWLESVQKAHLMLDKLQNTKVGIVIHAFYPDILEEIIDDLAWAKLLSRHFKLYVTTPPSKEEEIGRILAGSGFEYELLVCENRGRDILPFLKILPSLKKDKVPFLLKVHTKRSLHRDDGDQWRNYLFGQLLSTSGFIHAFTAMADEGKVALVSPDYHLATLSYYWGSNKDLFKNFCRKINFDFDDQKHYQFVAGSMFYARVDLFDSILDMGLDENDFVGEDGQIDGTLAHVLERFFGVWASECGYTLKTINMTGYSEKPDIRFH